METFGLRELRQNASDLVRRAEEGEDVTITVAGRPSVRLVPVDSRTWRSFADIADIFDGAVDEDWAADRDQIDQRLRDPWSGK